MPTLSGNSKLANSRQALIGVILTGVLAIGGLTYWIATDDAPE